MKHVVILGAGYAGLLTALRLQPQIQSGQAQVTLVNASDTFTERIRLHQVASGQSIKQHSIPRFVHGTGINFIQDYVRQVDPQNSRVILDAQQLDYDVLVMALGSHVNRGGVSGIHEHAYTLDKQSAQQLNERLQRGARLLVIGGGLTGIEAASEFAQRNNVDVTLVTRGQVGEQLSDKGRLHILHTLDKLGVTVREHMNIEAINDGYAESDHGIIEFDACLWAGGFVASPLAQQSGFAVNNNGQMLLQDTLQSVQYDNVFAVGDVGAIVMNDGQGLRMACAVAMPMGAHGADNVTASLNDEPLEPFRFAYTLQCISLGRRDALVQLLNPDDTPSKRIFTGRLGAFIKENICRYTLISLQLEKRFPGLYRYPKAMKAQTQSVSLILNSGK